MKQPNALMEQPNARMERARMEQRETTSAARCGRRNAASAFLLAVFCAGTAWAQTGTVLEDPVIAKSPQAIGGALPTNLMILIDNSSNMHWGHSPGNAERYNLPTGNGDYGPDYNNMTYRSSYVNRIYYNPQTLYRPPMDEKGLEYPNIDFHAAPRDAWGVGTLVPGGRGERPAPGYTNDLGTQFVDTWYGAMNHWTGSKESGAYLQWYSYPTFDDAIWFTPNLQAAGTRYSQAEFNNSSQPAYYGRFEPDHPDCLPAYDGVPIVQTNLENLNRRQIVPNADRIYRRLRNATPAYVRDANLSAFRQCFRKVVVGSTADGPIPSGNTTAIPFRYLQTEADKDCKNGFGAGVCSDSCEQYDDEVKRTVCLKPEGGNPANPRYNHIDNWGDPEKKKQNFANWYSYYRTRIQLTKSVMSRVMSNVNPNMRVGYGLMGSSGLYRSDYAPVETDFGGRLNKEPNSETDIDGKSIRSIMQGVRPFTAFGNDPEIPEGYQGKDFKKRFYDWAKGIISVSGTNQTPFYIGGDSGDSFDSGPYMKRALQSAGEYFRYTDVKGPWGSYPGINEEGFSRIQACRKSYTMLISGGMYENGVLLSVPDRAVVSETDQFWNTGDGSPGRMYTRPNCTRDPSNPAKCQFGYMPLPPYGDTARMETMSYQGQSVEMPLNVCVETTLANIATAYWKNDLFPDSCDLKTNGCGEGDNPKAPNVVPTTAADPAFWQHMNTMILNLGGGNSVDRCAVLAGAMNPDILTTPSGQWPTTIAGEPVGGPWNGGQIDFAGQFGCGVISTGYKDKWGYPGLGATTNPYQLPADRNNGWACYPGGGRIEAMPNNHFYGDDMFHAAVNSRGGFYNTFDPKELEDALNQAIAATNQDDVLMGVSASNSASPNRPMLYDPIFNSTDWSGQILGFKLCTAAEVRADKYSANPNPDRMCVTEGDRWAKPMWDANARLNHDYRKQTTGGGTERSGIENRKIITNLAVSTPTQPPSTADFKYDSLDGDAQTAVDPTANAEKRAAIVDYIRGSAKHEADGTFRDRGNNLLGDIVYGGVLYLGNDDFGYANSRMTSLDAAATARARYRARKSANWTRPEMVFATAGDGMVHAFSAAPEPDYACDSTDSNGTLDERSYAGCASPDTSVQRNNNSGGKELFAYLPRSVIPRLKKLSNPGYSHEFYVDGMPTAGDVYFGSGAAAPNSNAGWKSVVAGTMGAGGRGIYALDVENPEAPKVLFELSGGVKQKDVDPAPTIIDVVTGQPVPPDSWVSGFGPTTDYERLGFMVGSPSIALLKNGKWGLVFGNGYEEKNKNSGDVPEAHLFIADLENGGKQIADYRVEPPQDGDLKTLSNGLSTPIVIDLDQDGVADLAYAGDVHGSLWRFNLSASCLEAPESASCKVRLFEARDPTSATKPQPITAQPEVARASWKIGGGLMVYVGTGRFYAEGDKTDKSVQTFYGIHDKCGASLTCEDAGLPLSRADLLEQTIEEQFSTNFAGSEPEVWRVISENQLGNRPGEASTHRGFRIDLALGSGSGQKGERVIAKPVVWSNRLIFSSIEPDADDCDPKNRGWLYEVDRESGARLTFSVFDVDNNGQFGNQTDLHNDAVVSGKQVGMGSGITTRGATKYVGGSAVLNNSAGLATEGRRSWRQIR